MFIQSHSTILHHVICHFILNFLFKKSRIFSKFLRIFVVYNHLFPFLCTFLCMGDMGMCMKPVCVLNLLCSKLNMIFNPTQINHNKWCYVVFADKVIRGLNTFTNSTSRLFDYKWCQNVTPMYLKSYYLTLLNCIGMWSSNLTHLCLDVALTSVA